MNNYNMFIIKILDSIKNRLWLSSDHFNWLNGKMLTERPVFKIPKYLACLLVAVYPVESFPQIHIVLKEDISKGERVRKFILEGKTKKGWQTIFEGSCIGHKFIHRFDEMEVSQLRLKILESNGEPTVLDFSVYYVENL